MVEAALVERWLDVLDRSQGDVEPTLVSMTQAIASGEIRDAFPIPPRCCDLMFNMMLSGWARCTVATTPLPAAVCWEKIGSLYRIFTSLITLPEYTYEAHPVPPAGFVEGMCQRLSASNHAEEQVALRTLLHWTYMHFPNTRFLLRGRLQMFLAVYSRGPRECAGVTTALEVLGCVIRGFQTPLLPMHTSILHNALLPLHMPSGMLSMRYSDPIIAPYHQALVFCVLAMVDKDISLAVPVMKGLMKAWPTAWEANSMKEILLLGEVEQVLEKVGLRSREEGERAALAAVPLLIQTIGCPNGRVSERALKIVTSKAFISICEGDDDGRTRRSLIKDLLPILLQGGTRHWSLTVNQLRAQSLRRLHKLDAVAFYYYANQLWGDDGLQAADGVKALSVRDACKISETTQTTPAQPKLPRVPRVTAGTRPLPPGGRAGMMAKVGVMPGKGQSYVPCAAPFVQSGGGRGAGAVPVPGSNGVKWTPTPAPFARPASVPRPDDRPDEGVDTSKGGLATAIAEEAVVDVLPEKGGDRVLKFAEMLAPEMEEDTSQMRNDEHLHCLTPTLLPDLIFQELVFGHDLGSGAFATVRYARHIKKGEPQHRWPEYAVKVISTSKIKEMGYEASVRREMAVLRLMSHPGVARLIASFRWRDGAYLVLEFASKGDLFSQIAAQGKIDEACTKFWLGEVVAALHSVHLLGFVYGDLKPENILLTAGGHAKIGDFGAVRPISSEAKEFCIQSRSVLNELRSGDWRVKAGLPPSSKDEPPATSEMSLDDGVQEVADEDERMEGTALYLAPELANGAASSIAGDCWALGCVLYQCLTGKTPLDASSQAEATSRIVHFAPQESLTFPPDVSDVAKDLILGLLNPDPLRRLGGSPRGLDEVKDHPFFEGLDVPNLYKATPPSSALLITAPTPDVMASNEGKRQSSIMWTPKTMEAHSFVGGAYNMDVLVELPAERVNVLQNDVTKLNTDGILSEGASSIEETENISCRPVQEEECDLSTTAV